MKPKFVRRASVVRPSGASISSEVIVWISLLPLSHMRRRLFEFLEFFFYEYLNIFRLPYGDLPEAEVPAAPVGEDIGQRPSWTAPYGDHTHSQGRL